MVRPIVAPTVYRGTERIRLCLHAANTAGEVIGIVAAIEDWLVARMDEARRIDTLKQNAVSKSKI